VARKPTAPRKPTATAPQQPAKSKGAKLPTGGSKAARWLLMRPDTDGPKVRLGILWFLVALGGVIWDRWATVVIWSAMAGFAAWQTTTAWLESPRSKGLPEWSRAVAAAAAVAAVVAAGIGTALGGVALMVMPLVVAGIFLAAGVKPARAGAPLIGAILAALPALSVVLLVRTEQWAGLFLVTAVSFYDAGYFIGGAESSSRLEGPVTGIIGLLAVTFAASAIEVAPFDRVSAWAAGIMMALACPLGQMLVSMELPSPSSKVPAMRRMDAYLVAAPLMFAAAWALG